MPLASSNKSKKNKNNFKGGFVLGGGEAATNRRDGGRVDSATAMTATNSNSNNEIMRERRLAAFEGGGAGGEAANSSSSSCPPAASKASPMKETEDNKPNNNKVEGGEEEDKAAPVAASGGSGSKDATNNNDSTKGKEAQDKGKQGANNKPLTEDWKSWLRLNMARGCDYQVLYDRCVVQQGFCPQEVRSILDADDQQPNLILRLKGGEDDDGDDEKKDSTNTKEIWPEDLKNDNTLVNKTKTSTPLNNGWKEWIRVKLDQGCDKETIFLKCLQEGLNLDQVSMALGGYRSRPVEPPVLSPKLPFMKRSYTPRAWKLDTELAQVYEIPNFLSPEECLQMIQRIDNGILQRSIVTDGNSDSRTSHTCHLRLEEESCQDNIIYRVEQKLHNLMGEGSLQGENYDRTKAETLQGQRYSIGQYFQPHTDWFTPASEEYNTHCLQRGGQRTWTVMIYLNTVEQGGGTKFIHLDREFIPIPGTALVWNNLDDSSGHDGSSDDAIPNPWTLHEAMPVLKGTKYVLTKWFRERSMV